MALSPEAMEALDPATPPQRLRDIAREHPALQPLVVTNPACPVGIRDHILRTNPAAAQVYEAALAQQPDARDPEDAAPTHAGSADTAPGGPATSTHAGPVDTTPGGSSASTHAGSADTAPGGPATPVAGDEDLPDEGATRLISVHDRRRAETPAIEADDAWTADPGQTQGARSALSPATDSPSEDDLAATRALFPVLPSADEVPGVRTAPVPPAVEDDVPPPTQLPRVTGYLASLPDGPADAWTAPPAASGHGVGGPVFPGGQHPGATGSPQGQAAFGHPSPPQGSPSYGSPAYPSPSYPSPSQASAGYGSPSYGSPSPLGGPAAPTHGGPYPFGAGAAPGGPGRSGSGRKYALIGGLACLGLAALLVLAIVVGVTLSNRGREDAAPTTSSSTAPATSAESAPAESAAPTTDAPASPTEAPATEAPPLVSPAPEGSLDLTQVRSPSGNITCDLADTSVGCSVVQRSYGAQDCPDPAAPFAVTVGDAEAPTLACGQAFGAPGTENATVLEYGAVAAHGDVACRSESAGMTCWNQRTGHGFTLSRSTYAAF